MIRKEYIQPITDTILIDATNVMGIDNSDNVDTSKPGTGDPTESPAKKYSFWDDDDSETNDED